MSRGLAEYNADECHKLVGSTITGVCTDSAKEFMGLVCSSGHIAWILRDPEGNGPGFVNIEEDLGARVKKSNKST